MARTEVRGPILGSPVRLVLWKVTDLLLMLRLGVQMCLLLLFNLRGAPASCPVLIPVPIGFTVSGHRVSAGLFSEVVTVPLCVQEGTSTSWSCTLPLHQALHLLQGR